MGPRSEIFPASESEAREIPSALLAPLPIALVDHRSRPPRMPPAAASSRDAGNRISFAGLRVFSERAIPTSEDQPGIARAIRLTRRGFGNLRPRPSSRPRPVTHSLRSSRRSPDGKAPRLPWSRLDAATLQSVTGRCLRGLTTTLTRCRHPLGMRFFAISTASRGSAATGNPLATFNENVERYSAAPRLGVVFAPCALSIGSSYS